MSRSRTPRDRAERRGGRGGNIDCHIIRRLGLDTRENPPPSRVLGVFGMSLYTTERDLERIFEEFGSIDKVQLVMDHPRGRSRGFGFVYFNRVEDAQKAKEYANEIAMESML